MARSGIQRGKLSVRWKFQGRDGNRVLHFEWLESGRPGKVEEPVRQGFGMELLTRILSYDIGAKTKVEFNGQGLRFTMDMPTENIVAQEA